MSQPTFRAATITPGGGIESLAWTDRPLSEPGPGEVRVRIHAVSLNYRDLLVARGLYPLPHSRPLIPISDGSGEIDAVGVGVSGLAVGQRVVASFMADWVNGPVQPHYGASALGGNRDGMLAEYVILPAHALTVMPDSWSFAQAATLPCAGVTAWNALIVSGHTEPGDTVLIQGSGGVAVFALQIAKLAGARVIATSGNEAKRKRLVELGADLTINYRENPEWSGAVLEQTHGEGAHHAIDIGGPESLSQSVAAVRVGGTVSVIGILTGIDAHLSLAPILFKHVRLNGIFVGSRAMLESLLRLPLRPVIDRVFSFADTQAAYRYLESGAHLGKIVLER